VPPVCTSRHRPKEIIVSVIVIAFVTLDGVVSDPDGSDGSEQGGWAFRHGPQAVAGDKFRLGDTLDEGVLLLGRRTWQLFAGLFPTRDDAFSRRMTAVPKLVATRTMTDVSAWSNSALVDGELIGVVKEQQRDLIVAGSVSIVQELAAADLIDEYRLLIFPTTVGAGRRLFPEGRRPEHLETVSAELAGPAVLANYQRPNP
jgi:dihydrofolate reductase